MSVPQRLRKYPLIRVCHADCRSHKDCDSPGKRPVESVHNDRPTREINAWLKIDGNYGVVPRADNDLVIWDIDCPEFRAVLEDHPSTFTVESGSGTHRYYRCPEIETNRDWSNPKGSIRADEWHAVGPGSIHPETETQYSILVDQDIASVDPETVRAAIESLGSTDSSGVKRGGAAGAAAPPSSHAALEFIQRDDYRQDVQRALQSGSSHRQRVWMVGFLYGACGLRKNEIVDLIMDSADWAELDRETTEYQVQSVLDSANSSRGTHYSNYSGTGDMDGDASESRKTESGGGSAGFDGGDSMSTNNFDYTDIESLTTYEADSPDDADDGDRIVRVELTNMSGQDEEGEVDTDFVTVQKGTLRDNGEFGVSPEFNGDSKSVGAADPEDLRLIAKGLEEMADRIEE